jgi:hypothetical protein
MGQNYPSKISAFALLCDLCGIFSATFAVKRFFTDATQASPPPTESE